MRFFLGLVLGALLGGAGVYAWLERPWQQAAVTDAVDAGPAVADTKPVRKKQRRRGRRGRADVTVAVDGEVPALTDADRALVWKGDAVALPQRRIDMGSASEARSLDGAEINQVIQSQSGPILECITRARGNAPLDSRILVKMLVDGQGEVTRVRVRAPAYLFAHGFHACVRTATLGMRFPATGAHTVVDAPYDLY